MSKLKTFSTPLHGQADIKELKNVAYEGGWRHTQVQDEIARIESSLPGFEKAFLDEMDSRYLEDRIRKQKYRCYRKLMRLSRTSTPISAPTLKI
jgi:hypothetical protein